MTVWTIGREADPAKRIRQHQGATIRKLRMARGMAIADLAEAVGVTPGAISHYETGRATPRQAKQLAIADALGVPHSLIFGLDIGGVA